MGVRNCRELGINLQKIIDRLMKNEDLLKLLYYTDKDPLGNNNLTEEQKKSEVFNELVRFVPKVGTREDSKSTVTLYITNGSKLDNTEFVGITVCIDCVTQLDQWIIKDSNLRPFAILGELQKSLEGKVINGLGTLGGGDFELSWLTEEASCYVIKFHLTQYG